MPRPRRATRSSSEKRQPRARDRIREQTPFRAGEATSFRAREANSFRAGEQTPFRKRAREPAPFRTGARVQSRIERAASPLKRRSRQRDLGQALYRETSDRAKRQSSRAFPSTIDRSQEERRLEGLYNQLKEQFEEKRSTLDAARQELFFRKGTDRNIEKRAPKKRFPPLAASFEQYKLLAIQELEEEISSLKRRDCLPARTHHLLLGDLLVSLSFDFLARNTSISSRQLRQGLRGASIRAHFPFDDRSLLEESERISLRLKEVLSGHSNCIHSSLRASRDGPGGPLLNGGICRAGSMEAARSLRVQKF